MTDLGPLLVDLAPEMPLAAVVVDVVVGVGMVDLNHMVAAVMVGPQDPAGKVVDSGDMVFEAGIVVVAVVVAAEGVHPPQAYRQRGSTRCFAAAAVAAVKDILAGGSRWGWRKTWY